MNIWQWIATTIKPKSILTPFSKINIYYRDSDGSMVGYNDYYIFGIRIARIQKTEPWTS